MSKGISTGFDYFSMRSNPQSMDDIRHNMSLRHQMLVKAIVYLKTLDGKETAAAKQFWVTQTWFLVNFLCTHNELLNRLFDLKINPDTTQFTKNNLIQIIDTLISHLQTPHNENTNVLIQQIVDQSHSRIPTTDEAVATERPSISIQARDSISFTRNLIANGEVVVVVNAANRQRPGAGAYEQGTFDEALTRNSDLYWKFLADFYNVLDKNLKEGKTSLTYKETDLNVDVVAYQSRFLQMILFFIKKSIEDPHYFDRAESRLTFFKYADEIYSKMQNTVIEIPADGGFTKNCQFVDLQHIKHVGELFDERGIFDISLLEECTAGKAYIISIAAPDCRQSEGAVDKLCTINNNSRNNTNPDQIINDSIEYAIKKAINLKATAIILNAFGCLAFKNDPEKVAQIFSSCLLRYAPLLNGKKIYFLDLNPNSCYIFGKAFSDKLAAAFDINPTIINNTQLNIQIGLMKSTEKQREVLVAPITHVAESLAKENPGNSVLLIKTENDMERSIRTLKQIYKNLFIEALKNNPIAIRFPLVGTGNRGCDPRDSAQALIDTIAEISQKNPQLQRIKIYLHIPEEEKYHKVIKWLSTERSHDLLSELKKHYTIIYPNRSQSYGFGRGIIGSYYRIYTTNFWKAWTKISDLLYLGKIPTANDSAELINFIKSNETLPFKGIDITSVTEDFELAGLGLPGITPELMTAKSWHKLGIRHHHIPVRDEHADDFPISLIAKRIGGMLRGIEAGVAQYVHCKAGRSRSATLVILTRYYLSMINERKQRANNTLDFLSNIRLAIREGIIPDLNKIHDDMKRLRPEVSLTSAEFANIHCVIKLITQQPEILDQEKTFQQQENNNLIDKQRATQIDLYLASTKGKFDIAQLISFKELKYLALRDTSKMNSIKKLLNDIYNATDAKWFYNLINNNEPEIKYLHEEVTNLISYQLGLINPHSIDSNRAATEEASPLQPPRAAKEEPAAISSNYHS